MLDFLFVSQLIWQPCKLLMNLNVFWPSVIVGFQQLFYFRNWVDLRATTIYHYNCFKFSSGMLVRSKSRWNNKKDYQFNKSDYILISLVWVFMGDENIINNILNMFGFYANNYNNNLKVET